MDEAIWQAVKGELSGRRARDDTARIWEHARWNDFAHIGETASEIAAIMGEIGLEGVEVRRYPADGVTSYGGWVMPQAWDVEDATLQILEPRVPQALLARYRDCPQALMTYSAPTPPEGVEAHVVAVTDAAKPEAYDGLDVAGKLVLVDGIGLGVAARAREAGAVGIVSDAMRLAGGPHEPAGGHFDHAVQWHNYTIPPWRDPDKGFGFSISPADGRRLRDLLASHPRVRLKAVVRTRLYDGHVPLVTGLLPGETAEEIVITAHLCEPGANDNASGCALGLETVRTIAALCRSGRLPPLARGIRLIYSFEVRGYQAYLAEERPLKHVVAGINLDMVGNDLSAARSVCNLVRNWSALPAYTDCLAERLLRRLQRDDALFRFRTRAGELVDNLFGEPSVGAPMCVLGCWQDATYHTSLDVIETISPQAMAGLGRVAATYCALLAGAGFEEAAWLARVVADCGQKDVIDAPPARIEEVVQRNVERLRSIGRLVPPVGGMPTPGNICDSADRIYSASGLFEDEELSRRLEVLCDRLRAAARRRREEHVADGVEAAPDEAASPSDEDESRGRGRRLVPLRRERGSLCFESLDEAARRELEHRTGLTVGWGAPTWLQLAVFLANGKRSVLDIWRRIRWEAGGVPLARLCDAVEFLADHGFVRLRPVLTRADILAALRDVGLPASQVVMAHTSLSRFGYVEGGPDTVIDALVEAVGPDGTLVMPTLSCSWAGRPAFDPDATPARIGLIPNVFRRRPGVRRSPHPTHSVAALGPKAEAITRHHPPDEPVFSDAGAFGRLYALDAWILMLAPLEANTSMHMGEERAGVPLQDLALRINERGEPEGLVRRAPWHVNFDPHYGALRERGLLDSASLGDETIHLMRLRDAVDAAEANVRADPLLVVQDGCDCPMCQAVRAGAA